MANPFLIQPADHTGALNSLSQGLSNFQQQRQQKDAMARQQQMQTEVQDAVGRNDLNAIADLSIKYPEMSENIMKAANFKNDATKNNFKESVFKILSDPQSAEQVITDRIEFVKQQGGDPSQSMKELELFRTDPKRFLQSTEGVASALYGKEYKGWIEGMNQGKSEPMSEYQQAQVGLQRDRLSFDKEMKKLDYEAKNAERKLKAAAGTPKEAEALAKLEATKLKANEAKIKDQQAIESGIYTATQNKEAIDTLLNNADYMESLSGYSGRMPSMTTTGVEAEAYLDNIKNSMTIDNLSVMSGPLTDSDIKIIASASSRLRPGMSEKQLKKELEIIDKSYDRVIKNYQKEANRKGYNMGGESSSSVVLTSDKYGDVTEADITETMNKHGLTREEVMARLQG